MAPRVSISQGVPRLAAQHDGEPAFAREGVDERAELVGLEPSPALQHGPVEGDEPGLAAQPEVQRRHVAEAHQRLRRGPHAARVEAREETLRAVAPPRADDGLHARIVHELHQLRGASRVVAGQVAAPRAHVVPAHDLEASPLEHGHARDEARLVDGAGGRRDPEGPAGSYGARQAQRRRRALPGAAARAH